MKGLFSLIVLMFSLHVSAAPAIHGMVIFGKEKLYAYHLPMFHKIHNKQMVITFDVPSEVKKLISDAQNAEYLTFVPAPFDLDKFISAPFDLKGDLYSGHFEKEGTIILQNVLIKNPKIILLQELKNPDPEFKKMDYAVVGTPNDAYALHLINGSAAIDQIFKLKTISADDFETAISYHYLTSSDTLKLQSEYSISTPPGQCPSRLCGKPAQILATFKVESIYFEDSVM